MLRKIIALIIILTMNTYCFAEIEPIWLVVGQSVKDEEFSINIKELKTIHQSGRVYLENNAGYYDYDRYVLVKVSVTSPHYKNDAKDTYGKYTYKVYCDVGWTQMISGVNFDKKTRKQVSYSPDRYAVATVPNSIMEKVVTDTCETSKNNPFYPELSDK